MCLIISLTGSNKKPWKTGNRLVDAGLLAGAQGLTLHVKGWPQPGDQAGYLPAVWQLLAVTWQQTGSYPGPAVAAAGPGCLHVA